MSKRHKNLTFNIFIIAYCCQISYYYHHLGGCDYHILIYIKKSDKLSMLRYQLRSSYQSPVISRREYCSFDKLPAIQDNHPIDDVAQENMRNRQQNISSSCQDERYLQQLSTLSWNKSLGSQDESNRYQPGMLGKRVKREAKDADHIY